MKTVSALVIFFITTSFLFVGRTYAQSSQQGINSFMILPKVFTLGDHSSKYEELMPGYQSLLEACEGDMQVAHKKLYSMMKEMEAFAKVVDFDLDGVKAWMHFFFKSDGSIQHIGFHLKPNSRNVDTQKVNTFLKNFSKQYTFPINTDLPFSHYSTFSFPVF
ncbi:MAG: hypothetical protein AAFZ15_25290 [Bacteroidota bacterium]